MTFRLCKITTANDIQKWLRQALHCSSYSTLVTRSIDSECYFWFKKKKMLDSTNGVSSKSIGNHAQLNIMNKLYPVTLIKALLWNDTNMHMCSSN